MEYLITGAGASGTKWASTVMTELGSPTGHEVVYTPYGVKESENVGESSWLAVPYYSTPVSGTPVLKLIRNPLNVVRSLDQIGFLRDYGPKDGDKIYADFVEQYHPDIFNAQDRLGRLIRYVSRWDESLNDGQPVATLIIDRPSVDAERMTAVYRFLTGGEIEADFVSSVLARVGTSVNGHGGDKSTITWDMIFAHPDGGELVKRALQHGYV